MFNLHISEKIKLSKFWTRWLITLIIKCHIWAGKQNLFYLTWSQIILPLMFIRCVTTLQMWPKTSLQMLVGGCSDGHSCQTRKPSWQKMLWLLYFTENIFCAVFVEIIPYYGVLFCSKKLFLWNLKENIVYIFKAKLSTIPIIFY